MAQTKSVPLVQPVTMDSRKFLNILNGSVQSRINFFESKVRQMGHQVGREWVLVALHPRQLYIKEEETNAYFVANHRRESSGAVAIEEVKPVRVVERQKEKLFFESCLALVKALEENDHKATGAAFKLMQRNRFSSRIIPQSGTVRTRDGRVHFIPVAGNAALDEQIRPQLIAAIVESLRDRVVVENGRVVGGTFLDGAPVKLPVTRWSQHKLAARHMKEAARSAYHSPGFQQRMYRVAALVNEDKLKEAILLVTPFLKECEEFTLLNRKELTALVENTLAAVGLFNRQLCEDTATLVFRANLRVNKPTILREWARVAQKAQHPQLLSNVHTLRESRQFEHAYEKFLRAIFEAISNREVTASALATTLEVLRDRTPKIKESHELSSKLNELITRLQSKEFDDSSIFEAEDFIATVQEELASGDDLQNFDQMPGDQGGAGMEAGTQQAGHDLGDALGDELDDEAGKKGMPQIVINAPLISIGGETDSAAGSGIEGEEEGGDLDELLGGAQQEQDQEGADLMGGAEASLESRQRRRPAVSEEWDEEKYGKKPWEKGKDGGKDKDSDEGKDGDGDDGDEDDDPYAFDESAQLDRTIGHDYGAPALAVEDVRRIAAAMKELARRHRLSGQQLREQLETLAAAGFKAVGMRIPQRKRSLALDQVVTAFTEEVEQSDENWGENWKDGDDGRKRIPGLDETGDFNETPPKPEECGPGVGDSDPEESWFKWGTSRRKGGLRRAALTIDGHRPQGTAKAATSEDIQWLQYENDAALGELAGVRFIFDHGGGDPNISPVILSEDGERVEIPIPSELCDSAYASAGIVEGHDPAPFSRWLRSGLEQLRPLSEEEMDFGPHDGDEERDDMAPDFPPEGGMVAVATTEPEGGVDEFGAEGEFGGDEEFGGEGEFGGEEEFGGGMDGAVARITATPDGGLNIEVPAEVMHQHGEPDGDECFGEPCDDDDEMGAVDSVEAGPGDEDGGFDEFDPESDEEDDLGEDDEVTSPQSSRYTAKANEDKRDIPDAKLPPKSDDKLKGFETIKQGDKSGTNPPTSKPRSKD